MGLFDFIKKDKKEAMEPEQTVAAPAQEKKTTLSEDYLKAIGQAAYKYMPNPITAEHLGQVFDMANAIVDEPGLIKLTLESKWESVKTTDQTDEENSKDAIRSAFVESGFRLNQYMNALKGEVLEKNAEAANEETLLKAFIALDFYAFHLKPEYRENLIKLKTIIAQTLLNKGYTAVISRELTEFEALQERCHIAEKEAPDSDETKALKVELGKKLLELDKIYVLMDKDFNRQFPFFGTDGKIEICSALPIAQRIAAYYEKEHIGHVEVQEFTDVLGTLKRFWDMGVLAFRLDNGVKPVALWLKDTFGFKLTNLLEYANQGVKNLFLRELQYGYRSSKIDTWENSEQVKKHLIEMMLTMRYNAYRSLGNGLCYVFAPKADEAETTFYTKKALEKAKEMLEKADFPESALIAEGDKNYAVYTKPINLRVAQKQGQKLEEGLVCAFTGHKEAKMVKETFEKHGVVDSILVITFDELYSQAMQCAGILVDMPTYGLELLKNNFPEVLKWRQVGGGIIINLKNNDEAGEENV